MLKMLFGFKMVRVISSFLRGYKINSKINKIDIKYNDSIRAKSVMVIDENGNRLGELSIDQALQYAYSRDLDLIEVDSNSVPPVCKVVDYGKYYYQRQKKIKDQKKKQKIVELKEVKITPAIGSNDLETKITAAKKFLEEGNRVKLTLEFWKRYKRLLNTDQFGVSHPDITILEDTIEKLSDYGTKDKSINIEGNRVTVVIQPKKRK
jgi:translation initiation factor IF-3